jgi:eukaryotic-like serine/threonine-protein kinase
MSAATLAAPPRVPADEARLPRWVLASSPAPGPPPPEGPPVIPRGAEILPGHLAVAHMSRGHRLDVYDAWSVERDCRCVVKVVRPDQAGLVRVRRRLLEEGRLLHRLAHPNLVRAYEVSERPPAVVLETLTGATLEQVIEEADGLPSVEDLCVLGIQVASAVAYLHRFGVLHLDLKPGNVIVEDGRAVVIDLSVARRPGPGRRGVGTREYLSPEQARGDRLDPAADVWGLGAVLHTTATGLRPFAPWDVGEAYPQATRRAPALRSRRRLRRAFAEVVDACLDPDPAARPSLAEVGAALDRAAAS